MSFLADCSWCWVRVSRQKIEGLTESDQTALEGFGHGMGLGIHLQFLINVADVEANRIQADEQFVCGSLIPIAIGEFLENLNLTLRKFAVLLNLITDGSTLKKGDYFARDV